MHLRDGIVRLAYTRPNHHTYHWLSLWPASVAAAYPKASELLTANGWLSLHMYDLPGRPPPPQTLVVSAATALVPSLAQVCTGALTGALPDQLQEALQQSQYRVVLPVSTLDTVEAQRPSNDKIKTDFMVETIERIETLNE